jgi:hypothetical protein
LLGLLRKILRRFFVKGFRYVLENAVYVQRDASLLQEGKVVEEEIALGEGFCALLLPDKAFGCVLDVVFVLALNFGSVESFPFVVAGMRVDADSDVLR